MSDTRTIGSTKLNARELNARERRQLAAVEASPFGFELQNLLYEIAHTQGGVMIRHVARRCVTTIYGAHFWQGTTAQLLAALDGRASTASKNAATWPRSPQRAGMELNRIKEGLRLKNVFVKYERSHHHGRLWTFQLM